MPEKIRELEIIVPSQEHSCARNKIFAGGEKIKIPQVPDLTDKGTFNRSYGTCEYNGKVYRGAKFMLFKCTSEGIEAPFLAISGPREQNHSDIVRRIMRDTGNELFGEMGTNILKCGGGFYFLTGEEPVKVVFFGRSEDFGRFKPDLLKRAMQESRIQTEWVIVP